LDSRGAFETTSSNEQANIAFGNEKEAGGIK
jgi:hypothetical protein